MIIHSEIHHHSVVICFDDPSGTPTSVSWSKGSLVSVTRPSLSEKAHCLVTTLTRTTDTARKRFLCPMLQSPIFGCFKQKTNAFVPVYSRWSHQHNGPLFLQWQFWHSQFASSSEFCLHFMSSLQTFSKWVYDDARQKLVRWPGL